MKTRAGSPWIRSPLIGASLFFLALTLLVFRRLLPRLGEAAPAGADMLVYLWDGWWVHRALLVERVSPYWTDWINWPSGVILLLHSLALSVVAPWVWLAQWCPGPTGAVRAHNAAVLSSFVLTGVGVYALAARESGSRLAALVAAIPFCFSAQRFFLIGRLDLLGTQWVVFFVVAFLGALRGSVRAAVAGGVVAGILAYNNLTHLFFAGLLAVGLLVTDLRGARRSWAYHRGGRIDFSRPGIPTESIGIIDWVSVFGTEKWRYGKFPRGPVGGPASIAAQRRFPRRRRVPQGNEDAPSIS
jgi:hypothetical protein